MSKPIWFPFYPNDFLASSKVAMMDTAEIGAYLLLLCHAWASPDCSLPVEEEKLKKLSRFSGDFSAIRSCFTEKRGKLYNERLLSEWQKVKTYKEICSQSGKNGANRRWPQRVTPPVTPPVTGAEHSSPSPSPSPSPKNRRTKNQEPSSSQSEKEIPSASASPRGNGKSVETWESYKTSYEKRYGIEPIRNQSGNAMLCRLIDKIGQDAPAVAAFYLSHNDPFYVKKRHPINLLLGDAEGLRTQWATGVKATTGEAKNAELRDNMTGQFHRVMDLLKKEGSA